MIEKRDQDAYIRALFGPNAMHVGARMVYQPMGEHNGHPIGLLFGVVSDEMRHPTTLAEGHAHEFLRGDLVFRPHVRYADNEHLGHGVTNMITGDALLPRDWKYILNNKGVLVPNPDYQGFAR